jgi:hypothetical protein
VSLFVCNFFSHSVMVVAVVLGTTVATMVRACVCVCVCVCHTRIALPLPSAHGNPRPSGWIGRQLFETKRVKNDSEKSLTTSADVFVDTSVFEGLDLEDLGDLDLGGAEGESAGGAAAS